MVNQPKKFPLTIVTASGIVPNWRNLWQVYVVKFYGDDAPAPKKPKHGGGIGLPGERSQLAFVEMWDTIVGGMMPEELGISGLTADRTYPITSRIKVCRDVRDNGKMKFGKYIDGRMDVPEVLAGIPGSTFEAHHANDTVSLVLGVDQNPKTLVPKDPDEVEDIRFLDVRELPGTMPISDDLQLLKYYRRLIGGEAQFPENVVLTWCDTDPALLAELKDRIRTGRQVA